jgi:hypothetical protein
MMRGKSHGKAKIYERATNTRSTLVNLLQMGKAPHTPMSLRLLEPSLIFRQDFAHNQLATALTVGQNLNSLAESHLDRRLLCLSTNAGTRV